jgi:hypothetical protein
MNLLRTWNLHPTIVNGIHASIFIKDPVECRDGFPSLPPSHLQIRGNVVQIGMPKQELHRVERVALRNQAAYKCPSSTVAAMTSTEASGTIPSLAERGARTAMLIS